MKKVSKVIQRSDSMDFEFRKAWDAACAGKFILAVVRDPSGFEAMKLRLQENRMVNFTIVLFDPAKQIHFDLITREGLGDYKNYHVYLDTMTAWHIESLHSLYRTNRELFQAFVKKDPSFKKT